MCSVAGKLGLPGNCALSVLLELRLASLPIVAEYLSLSTFDHDQSLLAYLKKFPGGLWPDMASIPSNALYVLWSPLHSHMYAGRTIDFNRRHTDHSYRIHNPGATGQIPAYFFLREKVHAEIPPVASFFMLPVVAVNGGVPEAVAAERVFLGNFCFKLNTPHVYRHLSHVALELVNPGLLKRRKNLGPAIPLVALQPLDSAKATVHTSHPLARHVKKQRGSRGLAVPALPTKPQPLSSVGRILCALCFDRRDKIAKHGLRLLFVIKSRTSLLHIFHQVQRWATSRSRAAALKFVRKRACQLQLQLPVPRVVIELPWCGTKGNIYGTKLATQDFIVRLFSMGACQPSVFSHGRAKCQIVWKPGLSILDIVRTAPRYNKRLDDVEFCACTCRDLPSSSWPRCKALDGSFHVCARQSELPLPSRLDFLRQLSAHTRVVPARDAVLSQVAAGFNHVARALLDPFCDRSMQGRLQHVAQEFAQNLVDSWRLGHEDMGIEHVKVADVAAIKKLCTGLYIEALDKNTAEFVCMCPRMYFLQASGLFQHHPPDVLMIGASYRVVRAFQTTAENGCVETLLQEGELVKVSDIDSERVRFGKLSASQHDLLDCLQPVLGANFTYQRDESDWLGLDSIVIPRLRDDLQPAALNKRFRHRWLKTLAGREESWGKVRAVPKHKNLAVARPLGDQSCNPLSLLCRVLARFIDLCLKSLPTGMHFDRPTHQSVITALRKLKDRPFAEKGLTTAMTELSNYGVFILSRDVDNGFMPIQHVEAQQAWLYLKSAMLSLGRCSAWITTCSTTKRSLHDPHGSASWTKPVGTHWVKVNLDDVEPMLAFLFQHMQFSFGAHRGWQTEGIMMGQAAGGAIFRMVLVAHEVKALSSGTWLDFKSAFHDCSFCGIRFVDDLRILILYPLVYGEEWAARRADEILNYVYPPHLVMKDDAVNPFVGMRLLCMNGSIHWCAHHKPLGEVFAYNHRYQQALLPWCSFSPSSTFEAVLMGGFSRCMLLSSNHECLVHSLRDFISMITIQAGYPSSIVIQKLKAWTRKVSHDRNILYDCLAAAPTACDCDSKSFSAPQTVWPIGHLNQAAI